MDMVTGVSVFHCEVYFINHTVQMAVKWGTDSKIRFFEPTLGVPMEIGASGELNLAVSDSRKLMLKLVGTMKGIAWEARGTDFCASLQTSFKPLISTAVKSNLSAVIKKRNIDIAEIDEHLGELAEALKEKLIPGFEEYGLTIPQFFITNIVLSENDPNFKRLRELHTVQLQKQMAWAEAEVKTAQAESRAAYMSAEAEADAKIKSAQREAVLESQTTETEIAKKEAERKIIQSRADAEAAEIAGLAEAEVMRAQGYNKKDILQSDVQKAYAEGIGKSGTSGSGGNSAAGEVVGLGIGMAAMGAMAPWIGETMKGIDSDGARASVKSKQCLATGQNIKCPKCGAVLPSSAKFCLECGTNIKTNPSDEIICPHCGEKTAIGKYCMSCGKLINNQCPKCDPEMLSGAKD